MSVDVLTAEVFKEQLEAEDNKGKQVIVDFWASWCGPCRAVSPILDRIDEEDSNVTLLKVDVDQNPDIAAAFGIQSIPTLMFFKDGNLNASPIIGVQSKQSIEQHYQNV